MAKKQYRSFMFIELYENVFLQQHQIRLGKSSI